MIGGLHWIDGVIITDYACRMLAVGAYYSFRQKNSDEYFVGNRAMSPFLIGVSMECAKFCIRMIDLPGRLGFPYV